MEVHKKAANQQLKGNTIVIYDTDGKRRKVDLP